MGQQGQGQTRRQSSWPVSASTRMSAGIAEFQKMDNPWGARGSSTVNRIQASSKAAATTREWRWDREASDHASRGPNRMSTYISTSGGKPRNAVSTNENRGRPGD
jgi:hypothetical protein